MNDFVLYAPISKVNTEKRTVAGWATTEELDKQNEVVDYAGSKEAFSSWSKNVREMHEPKAVGKAIEILPNDEEKKIWVETYISKGAEDTWQKVQEGILTGFSIGGQTVNKTTQIVKDMNTGGQKTISRITKYKLNELSLVDNPANPGCSFTLVKSVNGIPFQTEIVEDMKKFVVTEAEDPLKHEVQEHRDRADSLIKKVLDRAELDSLQDDDFGVIRKSTKDSTTIKERLIPMPDKVHAVRALGIMDKYNLSEEEKNQIHKKAQDILGAAYDTYITNRGGETEVSKEAVEKLTEVISALVKRIDSLEKAFEGAHKPVPGAKETPKDAASTPNLGESSPAQAGAADEVQTQKPEGEVPCKSVKATDVNKAKNPATSTLETQEGTDVPAENANKDAESVVTPSAPEKPGAADAVETQPAEGSYPTKSSIKVEAETEEVEEDETKKVKKSDESEKDLFKLVNVVESLRKRFDAVEGLLQKPMPRKHKIEKNLGDTPPTADAQFQQQLEEVQKWVASGKTLTDEQSKIRERVLNKMLENKFGKAL